MTLHQNPSLNHDDNDDKNDADSSYRYKRLSGICENKSTQNLKQIFNITVFHESIRYKQEFEYARVLLVDFIMDIIFNIYRDSNFTSYILPCFNL